MLEALGAAGRAAFDQLYQLAEQADDELDRLLGEMSDRLGYALLFEPTTESIKAALAAKGGLIIKGRRKKKERALEKIFVSYAGMPAALTDLVRCSIAVDRCLELFTVAAALRDMAVTMVSRPKDRFAVPKASGYRDLETHLRLNCGAVAEVQLHLKPFLRIKEVGAPGQSRSEHEDYEEIRVIDARVVAEGGGYTLEEEERIALLRAQAKRLYGDAWRVVGACGTYA